MILCKKAVDLRNYLGPLADSGVSIGFVPTMGALHPGHVSLVEASKRNGGCTVCSIFVNPVQFNDLQDFRKYPVTTEKDIYLLEKNGVDVLFLPDIAEIYPDGTTNLEQYNLGYLETTLEGKYRPGHFQGVCQVMHRLVDIVKPSGLFMGQKDYQQCMVIKKMLADLHSKMSFHTCATLREADGLAMSSRNMRLNELQRIQAAAIYQALLHLQKNRSMGDLHSILQAGKEILLNSEFRIDYLEIANADTLEVLDIWDGTTPLVAVAAAFQGEVRLIDNLKLS